MPDDLVNKMFSFLTGSEADDKKMLLKQTVKDLSQNRYIKFFRIRTEEADTSLASFFFNIYKTTFPIRIFMQDEEKLAELRQKIIEAFMDPHLREIVRRLGVDALAQRAGAVNPDVLTSEIQADIANLFSAFDHAKIDNVNRCYNLVAALSQLAGFNFPSLLKKFDGNFIGGNFTVEPRFAPVKVELIYKELGEFLTATHAVNPEGDWRNILELLKAVAKKELVQPNNFSMMTGGLRDVHQSKILELMVQYSLKKPVWEWNPRIPNEHAAEFWLEAKKAEAKKCIGKIANVQKAGRIDALVKQIFIGTNFNRLEYYTVEQAEIYREKNLEDFLYAEGLCYLKAFLEDYLNKEIQELCDILLIRGQWTNNSLSKEMSEAVHELMEMTTPIDALDQSMAEEGSDGSRLKAAMLRVDRDKTQARYINSIIGNNNEEALEIINNAAQRFIIIGKQLKMLAEDIQKKPADLIINWRELIAYSRTPLAQRIADDYKKINYFVQLMRLCTMITGVS
jgi:hypothetical protein